MSRTSPRTEPNIGALAQHACTWEVLARKAGNVCPGREYPDLTVQDFLASSAAIAPILGQAPHHPLGTTILRAIEATRRVATTNTNLGIILLLAPLASVPLERTFREHLPASLRGLTVEDSRQVYAAIRLANPAGLGAVEQEDIHDVPTLPLRDAMALAREYDAIALQYVTDFHLVIERLAPTLVEAVKVHGTLERGIVETQLWLLSELCDSHILRKRGVREAEAVKAAALALRGTGTLDTREGKAAYRSFDRWLRADNHARNPGTTADLLAAGLFVALRDGKIQPTMPFPWEEHPFADAAES